LPIFKDNNELLEKYPDIDTAWKKDAEHLMAQELGCSKWYKHLSNPCGYH